MESSEGGHEEQAEFVRGFFRFCDREGIRAAVLHGWRDGFRGEISAVDFAVEEAGFRGLPHLIHRYCEAAGWRLCQILRHETTAAYFVCTKSTDPACAVALDACSDYRKDAALLIPCGELLKDLEPTTYGGYRLAEEMELAYLALKAVAKSKPPEALAFAAARYPAEVRQRCSAWLGTRGFQAIPFDKPQELASWIATTRDRLDTLRSHGVGEWRRRADRVMKPTGLIVSIGLPEFEKISAGLVQSLGPCFRRTAAIPAPSPGDIRKLLHSYLIVTPGIPGLLRSMLPASCHFDGTRECAEGLADAVARFLNARCIRREKLSAPCI